MNNLEKLLLDQKLKKDFVYVLNFSINEFDIKACFNLVRNIEADLKSLSAEAKQVFNEEINNLYLKVKLLALPRLKEGEVLEILESKLLTIKMFEEETFNLIRNVKGYLIGIIQLEKRDEFKLKVRQRLLANKEVVDQSSTIKTVGNWLTNIISEIDPQISDKIKETEYYLNNKNFKALDKENQALLKQIINLYKFCWYSSQTPEGLEESINVVKNGKHYTLEQGQIIEVKKFDADTQAVIKSFIDGNKSNSVSDSSNVKKLQEHYHSVLNKLVDKEKFKSLISTSKSASVILGKLNSNLALKDFTAVMANLEGLIKSNNLGGVLKDKSQSLALLAYIKSRFSASNKAIIKDLTPEVLSLFLQSIFVGKLKLKQEEAAILSLYLINQLAKQGSKQYLNIVFGDTKLGVFKWRNIKVEGDKLLFE